MTREQKVGADIAAQQYFYRMTNPPTLEDFVIPEQEEDKTAQDNQEKK